MHAGRLSYTTPCTSRRVLSRHTGLTLWDLSARGAHVPHPGPCHNVLWEPYNHKDHLSDVYAFREPGRRSVAACCATAAEVSSGSTPASGSTAGNRPANPDHPSGAPAPVAVVVAAPASVDATFASPCGTQSWRVRPYDNADYGAIIEVQTDSFHTANPVPFLNTLTYNNFRAEVVDALRQKTKYSDPSTFQLLVAEERPSSQQQQHTAAAEAAAASNSNGASGTGISRASRGGALVGSVEVSLMQEREVLRALPPSLQPPQCAGAAAASSEYAYVSSMCVRTASRRRGVAQALMAAAEAQARLWRQPRLALHVYKDNTPAVELYRRCGMQVLAEDPGWKAMLGGRVRLLMYKEVSVVGGGEGGEGEGPGLEGEGEERRGRRERGSGDVGCVGSGRGERRARRGGGGTGCDSGVAV